MKRDEMIKSLLKHHMNMVERLKDLDLNRLSSKQLDKLEEALEELESYAIVHVKANDRRAGA